MGSLGAQNTILGLTILNQDVPPDSLVSDNRGVYYSRLFQKPSNHNWYQIVWEDNQNNNTFQKINIDVRVRTGSNTPFIINSVPPSYFTFDDFNNFIKNNTPDRVDELLYRWQLGRSLLGVNSPPQGSTSVNGSNAAGDDSVFELGTAFNTARIQSSQDSIWNYWSLPHLYPRSYISNNVQHEFIQLRIDLRNLDPDGTSPSGVLKPEMYKITISSILEQGKESISQ